MVVVTVLGAGAMGAALTIPFTDSGNEVRLWFTEYDEAIWKLVHKGKEHPRIKVRLPDSLKLYRPDELEDAVRGADYVVIAVSSAGVRPVSARIKGLVGGETTCIVVAKGLEEVEGRVLRMTEIVERYAEIKRVVYVSGPSLAAELAKKQPTFVVFSSADINLARSARKALETEYYRIFPSDDVVGAELSAALKNVYAIAYGIATGSSEKAGVPRENLKAAVISKSLEEMGNIIVRCGGKKDTVYGLSGIGDLYVTATGGRNSMFGRLLGSGLSLEEVVEEMKRRGVGVVEGYRNAKVIAKFLAEKRIGREEAPLLFSVYDVLYTGASVEKVFKALAK